VNRQPKKKPREQPGDKPMCLRYHLDGNQALRNKTSAWQSDFTTEVTLAPSLFRHRDFADEKYLTRFVKYYHTESSKSMQGRIAKDQGDLRETLPPEPEEKLPPNMGLVFKPLDKEEEMGTAHEKAFQKGVNKQYIDKDAPRRKERSLRNTFPELMQFYDPKPKLFVRNFKTLRPSHKNEVLGEYRDPRPCVGIDKILSPLGGRGVTVEEKHEEDA